MANGAHLYQILHFVSHPHELDGLPREPWKVGTRQMKNYMREARKMNKELWAQKADCLFEEHMLRRDTLYALAMESADYNGALQIMKDSARLGGLYEKELSDRMREVEKQLGIIPAKPLGAGGKGVGKAPRGDDAPAPDAEPGRLPDGPGGVCEPRPGGAADARPGDDPPPPPDSPLPG
jgi:hypothetical protein